MVCLCMFLYWLSDEWANCGDYLMKTYSIKIIADYIQATKNEIAIDKSVYDLAGVTPESLGYIPRPAKVVSKFIKQRIFLKIAMNMLRGVWCIGGAPLFFFYEMVTFYKYSRRLPDHMKMNDSGQSGEYALGFSSRAGDILTSQVLGFEPKYWIIFPWANFKNNERKSAVIDVFCLLKGKDLFRAFVLSVIATHRIACREDIKQWALQSYTAFRWFAVRLALDKLSIDKLIIAEHYDRWAVLADSVVSQRRKSIKGSSTSGAKLVLVQHGSLSGLSSRECVSKFVLPFELSYKLKSVTDVFLYDTTSQGVFDREILSASCVRKGVLFKQFSPAIKLTEFPSENSVRLLFVGHPICERLHTHLLLNLVQNYDVTFYYKPHPTAGVADSVRRQTWQIIEGAQTFPEVGFLIAYPSTLVVEYAALGISAILHPLDLSPEFSSGLLESIKSKLDALDCKK